MSKDTEWAKVWEEQSNIRVSISDKRIWSFEPTHVGKARAEFMTSQINAGIKSHPEIKRYKKLKDAADKIIRILEHGVSGGYVLTDAIAAYQASKSEGAKKGEYKP